MCTCEQVPNQYICIYLRDTDATHTHSVVEPSAHAQACADHGLFSKRASAKTGVNVAAAFKELINDIHNQAKKKDDEVDYGEIVNIGGDTFDNSKDQCAC
jgi:hypothetical protein